MKNIALLFLAISVLVGGQSWAGSHPMVRINFDWYLKNYDYVMDTVSGGPSREVIPVINTLGAIWSDRDGAIGAEVAPAIGRAFAHHPKIMFQWFSQHPAEFQAWLDRLPYALLTDHAGQGDSYEQLVSFRSEMIGGLAGYATAESDPTLKGMAKQLLDRLRETEVRRID